MQEDVWGLQSTAAEFLRGMSITCMSLTVSKAPETEGGTAPIFELSLSVVEPEGVTWFFLFRFKSRLTQPSLL